MPASNFQAAIRTNLKKNPRLPLRLCALAWVSSSASINLTPRRKDAKEDRKQLVVDLSESLFEIRELVDAFGETHGVAFGDERAVAESRVGS